MNWYIEAIATTVMTASTSVDPMTLDLKVFLIVLAIGLVAAIGTCATLISMSHTKQKATSIAEYNMELKLVRNSDVDTGTKSTFKSDSSTPTRKKESYVNAEKQKQMLADTVGEFSEGLGLGQAEKAKDAATKVLGKFMGRGD